MPDDALGRALLTLARNAINARFSAPEQAVERTPALEKPGASFVTLTQNGRLRGCIGSLEAYRPLANDIAENACAAAFHDSRFPPLTGEEWLHTRVEVSLLEAPVPMTFSDENDAIAQLRPGIDGIVLGHGKRRATFLPQVWESLPDPHQFLAQLKLKAGLPPNFWDEEMTLARYRVQKWKET